MSHRTFRAAAAALLVLATAVPASALDISGTLRTVDLAGRHVTIADTTGRVVTLAVTDRTVVTRNGENEPLRDLVLGDAVAASYDRAASARSLAVRGPRREIESARVLAVDSANGFLVAAVEGARARLRVNANTRFSRNGRVASLDDLTRLDRGTVALIPGTPRATAVTMSGPEKAEVRGTVANLAGDDVTVQPATGAALVVHVVAGVTLVELEDRPAAATALVVGQAIEVAYDPETHDALRIHAEDARRGGDDDEGETTGTLSAVGSASVSVLRQSGDSLELTVVAATEITIGGAAATLADLRVGQAVEVEWAPSTGVARRIHVEDGDGDGDDHGGGNDDPPGDDHGGGNDDPPGDDHGGGDDGGGHGGGHT